MAKVERSDIVVTGSVSIEIVGPGAGGGGAGPQHIWVNIITIIMPRVIIPRNMTDTHLTQHRQSVIITIRGGNSHNLSTPACTIYKPAMSITVQGYPPMLTPPVLYLA